MHAPDGWIPSDEVIEEELKADVNARDSTATRRSTMRPRAATTSDPVPGVEGRRRDGVTPRGQTVVDMANGPVQRVPPFLETITLLEKLGSKNNHKCRSC